MKPAIQFASSLIALGALLGTVVSNAATNVSELPLKASVLAKPNVIFGMDDSGSMDWEVLLDTPSGIAYWDGTTAWDGTTNLPRRSSDTYSPLEYLFPMGVATGGQIYATSNTYGRAVPPTPQFAWLRSFAFNPLYYNSSVTYAHWSPAYFGGSLKTYADASTTAAKSHPAVAASQTINLTADWDSANTSFTDVDFGFRVLGGMVLPAGTSVIASSDTGGVCAGSTRRTLTAPTTVDAGSSCRAGIPYYPATFWQPTVCPASIASCTPAPDCTVDGSTCVAAPNGSGKLRRYEIKSSGSFPSGRSYADEMKNFANWFTYYRKRKLMLAGSMGRVLENITGLRMGVVPFNNRGTITMNDADSTTQSTNRLAVAGRFYLNSMASNGTPTLSTIKHIGEQVDTDTEIIKFACQRNNAFIVTDGFANDLPQTAPTYNQATFGTGAPYATTHAGTQADLALAFYTNRLRGGSTGALPAGLVPTTNTAAAGADLNTNLHLNFYAISLGVKGSQYTPGRDPYTNTPSWTMPVDDDPSMIDDLWHATINGRGKMYLATTPNETFDSIESGLNDILNIVGAQSGVSVSTVNLSRSDGFAYMARYNPARWAGDLTANPINANTGAISTTATWSAATLLAARDWTARDIVTQTTSGTGTVFNTTNVGATVNPGDVWGVSADVIDYLRGDRSKEGTTFRRRSSLIGAVINAEPVISRDDDMVFIASGEGMLHAFDTRAGANRGKELWAFVPRAVLPDIGQTSSRAYTFKTQLDGTPTIGKTGTSSKLLVAGMGAAGRSYYALDVSSPRTLTQSDTSWVKWEFPAATDTTTQAKVGQTVGKPLIVNTASGYRVLVTSGYNSSADGKGRLFVLNPADGTVAKEFATADGSLTNEAGLAHVAAYRETDGTVRYVYGGDLLGNLWRFDLAAATGSTAAKVAVLQNGSGQAQAVTVAPELASFSGKRVVMLGTGRMLDVTDWGVNQVQTLYAIADGSTLTNVRSSLVQQTYNGHSTDTITAAPVDWATQRGWYMDLPAGEHANTQPAFADGILAVVTNKAGASDCSASSYLYVLGGPTGAAVPGLGYVSSLISATSNASSVRAVLTTSQNAPPPPQCTTPPCPPPPPCPPGSIIGIGQTSSGQSYSKCIGPREPILPGKNSWREVRPR